MSSQEETEKIKIRYEKRKSNRSVQDHDAAKSFIFFMSKERERIYTQLLQKQFNSRIKNITLLEIGAGNGGNIAFFKDIGISASSIYANELLEDRIQNLRENHPEVHILPGDARKLLPDYSHSFDVVFQSTVFTSILEPEFKKELADCCLKLLKPDGMVLWYDFAFDNPKNKDVKGIKKKEIRALFPNCNIAFYKVTLAPPIGRRVGKLYPVLNALPFLRTHLVAAITPKVIP